MSKWNIAVIGWENVKKGKKNDYTLFHIKVATDTQEWIVQKRFSDIYAFHEALLGLFETNRLPEFPPRTLTSIGNFEPAFLEKRRAQLEQYFRALPVGVFLQTTTRNFFGADDPSIPKRAVVPRHLFTLPPNSNKLPDTITLHNGEEFFINSLVTITQDILDNVRTYQDNLFSCKTLEERLAFLEQTQSSRATLHTSLLHIKEQLSQLLASSSVSKIIMVYNYLSGCAAQVLLASDFISNVEDIAFQLSDNELDNIEEKINRYNVEAEELLTAIVQGIIPKAEISTRIKELLQNIEYDKKVYALRKQDDVVSKLEQVKQYITSQGVIDAKKGTVKDTTFASHTVIELEEALFSIIDELSRLETLVSGTSIKTESHPDSGVSTADDKSHEVPPLPESGATSVVTVPRDSSVAGSDIDNTKIIAAVRDLRDKFDNLSKNLAALRHHLDKLNDEANTHVLHRLADMQENLADLEYRFTERFESVLAPSTLHGMLKARQVREARRDHSKAEADMFEL